MHTNPVFSCSKWLKTHHMWDQKREGKTLFCFAVWHTNPANSFELYEWNILRKSHVIACIFSHNSHVHFSLFCVCMPFPLVVSPLYNSLRGHVAGSRSVSAFPGKGGVTSGFLCGEGQVLLLWGAQDFLHGRFVGKCLKLDPVSQGPVGG